MASTHEEADSDPKLSIRLPRSAGSDHRVPGSAGILPAWSTASWERGFQPAQRAGLPQPGRVGKMPALP